MIFKVRDRVFEIDNVHKIGEVVSVDLKNNDIEVLFDDPIYRANKCSFKNTWTYSRTSKELQLIESAYDRLEGVHNTGMAEAAEYLMLSSEPKKYNDNKPMMSLIRPEFQLALAECLTYGYTKYEEQRGDIQNYLKGDGFHYSTIIDSLERHLNAFKSGVSIDEESGLEHLVLATANLMFLHTYEQCERGIDDRIKLEDLDEEK